MTRELARDAMFAEDLDAETVSWMVGEMFKTPTEVAATMFEAVARCDLRPLLPSLTLPTLVVNGGVSAVPTGVGTWLVCALADATSVVLPAAGHAPFWDDARGFNDALTRFALQSPSPANSAASIE